MRDYKHEYEIERNKKNKVEVKLLNEDYKAFKDKLEKEGKNASEFLREYIYKYINKK